MTEMLVLNLSWRFRDNTFVLSRITTRKLNVKLITYSTKLSCI